MSEGLKAHVKNGQIVLDTPASLPEGARLRVFQVGAKKIDPELDEAIENSFSDFAKGEFADAKPFARKLARRDSNPHIMDTGLRPTKTPPICKVRACFGGCEGDGGREVIYGR